MPFLFVGLEAAHRHVDVVVAGEQIREEERAVRAGHRLAGGIGAGVLEDDGRAWKHAAAGVGDRAGNLAGQSLCLHGTHRPAERDEQRDRRKRSCKDEISRCTPPGAVQVRRLVHPLENAHSAGCPFRLRMPGSLGGAEVTPPSR